MRAFPQFTGFDFMRFFAIAFAGMLLYGTAPALQAAEAAPPAPPAMPLDESVDEPQVTITKETDLVIEEYRSGGKLYMIKVTPKYGKPYYLVDDRGDGKFVRQDSLDSGFRVPRWIIHSF